MSHDNKIGLIVMEGAKHYSEDVIKHLLKKYRGLKREDIIIETNSPRFSTGEGKCIINSSVRGHNIYILCDVFNYGLTYNMYGLENHMSPDDHYQDIIRMISALAGVANKINVIMPMLYEGRQHRATSCESLDCAIFLRQLEQMGVDNIITFDAHDERVKNAIPLCGFDNIFPSRNLIEAFLKEQKDIVIDKDNLIIVSPDEGAIPRCIDYASKLGLDLGVFYKRRDYSKVVNGKNPIIAHEFLGKDLNGMDAIIIDDMISSGGSIIDIMKKLKNNGASNIYVFASFGLFTEGIEELDKAYHEGLFEKIYTTNLTYLKDEDKNAEWLTRVDMSEVVGNIIYTIENNESMGDMLKETSDLEDLLNNKKRK